MSWFKRKARLRVLLKSQGDEDQDALALDRLLHGQSVIGKTSKTTEIDGLRFTDRDLSVVGTLEYGQFGVIDVVNCHLDGRVYVRKSIEKRLALKTRDQCSPQTERDILLRAAKSDSQWVPHLLCAFQTPSHLSLVMDYAEGGTLWDVLESSPLEGKIPETDLKWWAPQLVSAIHWCHSQGFVHRDIKPHNFVLTPSAHVLLIDFGSAAPLLPPRSDGSQGVPKRYCLVPCGTCDYISPEILQAHEEALVALEMDDEVENDVGRADDESGGYGLETDWWSLGAMLYELAYGIAPFFANDIRTTYLRIMDYETSLRFNKAVPISGVFQDLVRRLLTHHETRLGRKNIMEITEHPFFDDMNWSTLHSQSPPPALHLPQFTYSAVPSSTANPTGPLDETHSQPFAFSALFQSSQDYTSSSSPGISALHTTPTQKLNRSILREQAVASFIGFSWGPAIDAFPRSFDSDSNVSPQQLQPSPAGTALRSSVLSTPNAFLAPPRTTQSTPAHYPFSTPVRPNGTAQTLPRTSTVRRTAPRRAVSDREAMKQLVDCVGMSAHKKVLESGRKPRILTINTSMANGTGTLKKELRFDAPPRALPAVFIPATSSATSGSEDTESEGPPSPSPSPRPGSAMSMMSRRSQTPTISGSYSQRLTTPSTNTMLLNPSTASITTRSNSWPSRHSDTTRDAKEPVTTRTFVKDAFHEFEERHVTIMSDIEGIERRVSRLLRQVNGEG